MDNFKEDQQLKKRIENAKSVLIIFTKKEDDIQFFNVTDEHGSVKYDGHFDTTKLSVDDYCKCKSFENGNNSKTNGYYPDTHGHAFQCKHLIQARDEYTKQNDQSKIIENAFGVKEVKPKDTTFYESNMIQKDLLLD